MTLRAYLKLVQKYSLLDFTKIVVERGLGRLTGGAINRFFFDRAMAAGHVYFGEHLGARQGVLGRHFFIYRLAREEAQRQRSHAFEVVEVGSYAGASAITWALGIKSRADGRGRVTCIDPWRNYITEDHIASSATPDVLRDMAHALESGRIFQLFEHNIRAAGVADLIQPVKGRFEDVAESIQTDSCDIVYIDADHHHQAVLDDLKRAARLVRVGGILCGDDLEAQWPVLDQAFCGARLASDLIVDPRTHQCVHPGVTKAVWDFFEQPVSAWNGFWAMRKSADGGWQPVAMSAVFRRTELPPHVKWWRTKTESGLSFKARQAPLSPNGREIPETRKSQG